MIILEKGFQFQYKCSFTGQQITEVVAEVKDGAYRRGNNHVICESAAVYTTREVEVFVGNVYTVYEAFVANVRIDLQANGMTSEEVDSAFECLYRPQPSKDAKGAKDRVYNLGYYFELGRIYKKK